MSEKDKKSICAIPGHMCMGEAVPFGQRFTYHTEHSIEDILSPSYFLTVRSYFEVGDELRVVRIENGRVKAILDLMAVEARAGRLEFCLLTPIVYTEELALSRQALAALREQRPGCRPKDQSNE